MGTNGRSIRLGRKRGKRLEEWRQSWRGQTFIYRRRKKRRREEEREKEGRGVSISITSKSIHSERKRHGRGEKEDCTSVERRQTGLVATETAALLKG